MYKLNMLEPWEYGTEKAIDASIVKQQGNVFLLRIDASIRIKEKSASYFVFEFQSEEKQKSFLNGIDGVYPISMVFDENINDPEQILPNFADYRGGFLSGELII
jgi:hypothetical protein